MWCAFIFQIFLQIWLLFSAQLLKEFGTIFQNNEDRDTVRKLPTPVPEDIETNLDNFLKRWNNFLKLDELKGTVAEMERLRSHVNCLRRALASLNLRLDPVVGDGDCAFRSMIVQLRKTKEWKDHNVLLMEHLAGLGLGKGLDEDVFQLRQCFVNAVQSSEYYQRLSGIPLENINDETERFRDQGTFCGEIGDLVIRVCADILKIPITVITSMNGCPSQKFTPEEIITGATIYVAYTACGPGPGS